VAQGNISSHLLHSLTQTQNVQQVSYAEYIQLLSTSYYLFFGLFNSLSSITRYVTEPRENTPPFLRPQPEPEQQNVRSVMQNTSSFISILLFLFIFVAQQVVVHPAGPDNVQNPLPSLLAAENSHET